MTQNREKNWFGTQEVTPEQKTKNVIGVFDSVADNYDQMNDLMSGGLHRLWKDHLVRKIRPRPGLHYLDVAGGTGDIAFRIYNRLNSPPPSPPPAGGMEGEPSSTKITLCDLNAEMLRVGRDRALDRGLSEGFEWVTGNAEALPLPDNTVDVYTIAFGLRNVTHIDTALAEAFRVLKPGGRFYCLEFSRVQIAFLAKIYDEYSYRVIPKIGEIVAKDRESYQYLVESIRKFPSQRELLARLQAAGFTRARVENLTFGVVAIHEGVKI
jgi:demethylmenaquinone methyltransferase/2-methoxy-6-polyprenyl-1,4-benzoquinol methylase